MASDEAWFHVSIFSSMGAFLMELGLASVGPFRHCGPNPLDFADPDRPRPRDMGLRVINEIDKVQDCRSRARINRR